MNMQTISKTATAERLKGAVDGAINREAGLSGVVVMYGESGVGKTAAIGYCVAGNTGYYVECRSSWTRKAFLVAVMKAMGADVLVDEDGKGKGKRALTISEMVDCIGAQLNQSRKPLFVDDVQYLLERDAANVLTDIHNTSGGGTLVLVGEERVPKLLRHLERLHNRVLTWVPANPGTVEDISAIAEARWPDVLFDQDLLASLIQSVKGCLRRAINNLVKVRAFATEMGMTSINLTQWEDQVAAVLGGQLRAGTRIWDAGEAPTRENEKAREGVN